MSAVRVARPRILARVPATGHAVIEASAGTGKTYTLEHLVIDLLLGDQTTIGRMLVVTFTDKGARELRARIRATIQRILEGPHDARKAPEEDDACWVVDDDARARLTRALDEFDEATISTIHAFCHRVLTEFSFDTQRAFEGEQVDGRRAFSEAFTQRLRETLGGDEEARAYLEQVLGTGVSVEEIESFLYACHRERGQRTPTFDPERFGQAMRLVPEMDGMVEVGQTLTELKVNASTRRALATRCEFLSDLALRLRGGQVQTPGALAELMSWHLSGSKENHLDYMRTRLPDGIPHGSEAASLRDAVQGLTGCAVPPVAALADLWLPSIRQRLTQRKRDRGLYDYDDMLTMVRDALRGPSGPRLLAGLRGRYDCALIDEFQDTDEVQWEIFRRIFFESTAHRLFLIGDPKQAIYGFRNADVHTYLAARQRVAETAGEPLQLQTNYRSSADLIRGVDAILLRGQDQALFTQGDIRYPGRMACGRPDLALTDSGGDPLPPVTALRLVGRGPEEMTAPSVRRGLYEAIAVQILGMLDPARQGPLLTDESGTRRLVPSDIHILTRKRSEAMQMGEVLREAGIAHAFFRQDGLMSSDEALDVLHLLKAIADPSDRSARIRAWLTPFFGLELEDAVRCAELGGDHPLVERLQRWKAMADAGRLERMFASIGSESGFVGRELFCHASERTLTNIQHLLEILLTEARRAPRTLADLITTLRSWTEGQGEPGEDTDIQRLESEGSGVQILTMHKAKGLQAPVVFLAGGVLERLRTDELLRYHDGSERYVHVRGAPIAEDVAQRIDQERYLESVRLLYVAMTRARVKLFLPYLGDAPSWARTDPDTVSLWKSAPSATYRPLNERLAKLLAAGDPATPELFDVQDVPVGRGLLEQAVPARSIESWTPPAPLLEDGPDREGDYLELRRSHAGYIITSYSAMRPRGFVAHPDEEKEVEFIQTRDQEAALPGPDDLPGGLASGTFIHDVLEHVDFRSALAVDDPQDWGADERIHDLFVRSARRGGIDTLHLPHAKRLVHATLRAPLVLGDVQMAQGLASLQHVLCEMELVYPIPEQSHPQLGAPTPGPDGLPFAVKRGLIRGFVDLIFEHRGRVYFADYKSDSLTSWDRATITAHVQDHYELQARIYALGLVRMLGIGDEAHYEGRFGGLAYLFVRGMDMDDGTRGVYFQKPTFDEVRTWEQELSARSYRTPGVGTAASANGDGS